MGIMNDGAMDYKIDSASDYIPVAKADAALPDGPCRGLLVGVAGTANLTTVSGTSRDNVPLQAGINPLVCSKVRLGGTADEIFALY